MTASIWNAASAVRFNDLSIAMGTRPDGLNFMHRTIERRCTWLSKFSY